MNMKIKINKEDLHYLYQEQEYSLMEISKIFNCSWQTIRNNLKNFGIKIRTLKEASNTKKYIAKMTAENNPKWKGGIAYSDGYIYILKPDHPKANKTGYIKRSQLVLEKKLGRYLYPDEIPHHKNEIRDDDRPENIKVMESNSVHVKYHWQIKRKIK